MKTLIFLIFMALGASSSASILKIDIEETSFKGSLKDFVESNYFDSDNSQGDLLYKVVGHNYHFKDAKKIAFYVWNTLTSGASVTYPYPCGYALRGKINESGKKALGTIFTEYTIKGVGDGGRDSCTGGGGPGLWQYKITVTFNPKNQTGTINYDIAEE